MSEITATNPKFKKEKTRAEIVGEKATQAITQIDADIATLNGSPTNAELIAIVKRTLQRQRKIINYLANLE